MLRSIAAAAAALLLSTIANPAAAAGLKFSGGLSGDQQVPAVTTTATGKVTAKFDDGLTEVVVKISMTNISNITAAHFHCNLPGQNGSVAFSLIPGPAACAVVNNQISCTLTNADMTPNTCASEVGREVNNIAALAFAMREGLIYANVHTMANTGGEIRGQMVGK